MRRERFAGAGLALLLIVLASWPVSFSGPSWHDEGPAGHSTLVSTLSTAGKVRILEGSMAPLPAVPGPEDAAFLFPSHRAPTINERRSLEAFVGGGGLLIVAGDGGHTGDWLATFELPGPLGITPNRVAASDSDCVNTTLGAPWNTGLCLPSPTTFATDSLSAMDRLEWIAFSREDLYLDVSGSSSLDAEDQGGKPLAVAYLARYGLGRVLAVSDGDIWGNADQAASFDAAALLLPGPGGRIFVDSSSDPRHALELDDLRRLAAAPGPAEAAAIVFGLLAASMMLTRLPRVQAWVDQTDPILAEDPAHELLIAKANHRTQEETP